MILINDFTGRLSHHASEFAVIILVSFCVWERKASPGIRWPGPGRVWVCSLILEEFGVYLEAGMNRVFTWPILVFMSLKLLYSLGLDMYRL